MITINLFGGVNKLAISGSWCWDLGFKVYHSSFATKDSFRTRMYYVLCLFSDYLLLIYFKPFVAHHSDESLTRVLVGDAWNKLGSWEN